MHRILSRPVTGMLVAVAVIAAPAGASTNPKSRAHGKPPSVFVRVEGAGTTLLPQTPVQTENASKVHGRTCPGTSAAGALALATHNQWTGTWFKSFKDFQVMRILGETPAGTSDYWTLWINGVSSSTGACSTKLHPGDHELWFDCLGDANGACSNDPLAITGPAAVRRGHKVTVRVTQLDAGGHGTPVARAAVTGGGVGAVTAKNGTATFVPRRSGEIGLRAAKSGATPSDTKFLCVYPRRRAQCAAIRRNGPLAHMSGIRNEQMMVVGRTKTLLRPRTLTPTAGTVAIGRRRCAVPRGTALAALLAAKVKLHVSDRSGCDPASMFVTRIGRDANHGAAGWEYKVGHADPSFGAADPAGRLRGSRQLLWYWCTRADACQRTLAVTQVSFGASTLTVKVKGYDDTGHGIAVPGATVHYGSATGLTDASGTATFPSLGRSHQIYATKAGLVRSFPATSASIT